MITVERLEKTYRTVPVLQGVDHTQKRGEVVVIIGPSGSGKSTFLRCLNQLERPDSGTVTIDGFTVQHQPARGLPSSPGHAPRDLRLRIGMVFQSFNLFPHLTALENITRAPQVVKGVSRADADAIGMTLLKKVGLEEKAAFYPGQLSGGQQQRVAIARALAMQPKVMLFDEPTSALDPELRGEVRAVIRRVAEEGMTMLVVTHEMNLVHDLAHRVIFMDCGRVIESGAPSDVLQNPRHERTRAFLRGAK